MEANYWKARHEIAWRAPRGMEKGIVSGIKSWIEYAKVWREAYDGDGYDGIGSDGYASEYWLDWGKSLRGLLSMDCGRLDCGTLDSIILDTMKANGIDIEAAGL